VLARAQLGDDAALDRERARTSETVSQLIDLWLKEAAHLNRRTGAVRREQSVQDEKGRIAAHITPLLGQKRLVDLKRADMADVTKSLAGALAAITPHIHGEQCPVCDRDFREQEAGPLSAHLANKIANLTTEAGRLQALATERADVTARLATAQRDVLAADRDILPAAELAQLTNRSSQMSAAVETLKPLEAEALRGAQLLAQSAAARSAAAAARRASELSTSVLPELDRLVTAILGAPLQAYDGIDIALTEASAQLHAQISAAEAALSTRVTALTALDQYAASLTAVADASEAQAMAQTEQAQVASALADANTVRETAKTVSDAAESVRSAIVKRVFNTSLNRTWRDLFVRLAPSEAFVPKFRLPSGDKGKVEAVLETEHRSGQASGTPGAMLSQGNLNTAALTLFLALHLSVPQRTPWLVLDDPVQSMDDVHIAQFAALLRTPSKGAGRQVVVAVHERALFDYLTLELSPAFPGDTLITVEISRTFDGVTVARATPHSFEDDKVVAAQVA
jgi:exonuclease SbcC